MFSATSREISLAGISRRLPSFTLLTLPLYAHRRHVQRLTPVTASASATPRYSALISGLFMWLLFTGAFQAAPSLALWGTTAFWLVISCLCFVLLSVAR